MHIKLKIVALILFSVLPFVEQYTFAQKQEFIKSNGEWIKVRIYETGIYKLTYSYLKNAGIDNPELAVVVGKGGAFSNMINEKQIPRDYELPLYCNKGEDGVFGKGDYYLFFARGPEDISYDDNTKTFIHHKNKYEDFATYFVGYGNITKKDIPIKEIPSGNNYIEISDTDFFLYHEENLRNLLKSGRNKVGEKFSSTIEYSFKIDISNINVNENVRIKTDLLARGISDSEFEIYFNGNFLGALTCEKVNVTSFSAPFATEKIFDAEVLGRENNDLRIKYRRDGGNVGWLDYFSVQGRKRLILNEGNLIFSDSRTVGTNNLVRYNIKSKDKIKVWEITDIEDVREILVSQHSENNYVVAIADKFRQYVAFDPFYEFPEPELIEKYRKSTILNIKNVEMLIVTVKKLEEQAVRLADFHDDYDIKTKVVLADDIYNEFSSGQKHPIGIRDFVRYVYMNSVESENRLKYLCLFGDGSYDAEESLLPTWQTLNSLEPANSFVSDDFFGLLDEGEGEAIGDLDIGIGRIPVNTLEEAASVVDKIIAYKESQRGNWITRLAFVADDGDYNEHIRNTDIIAEMVDSNHAGYRIEKLYMDDYSKQDDFDNKYYPGVNRELNKLINDGLFICNYIGHGNENGLAHEKILTVQDIHSWKNKVKLPLFITATCDFSRFDDHNNMSAGERILLKANGGAIALLSTTRLVYSSPNFIVNKEFFRNVFNKDENNKHYRLGDLIKITKNNSEVGINMRNLSLIGDPALLLNYPNKCVKIVSVSDTIKAYGKGEIVAEICFENGIRDNNFNGIVDIIVYGDKEEYQTLGNESSPFKYNHRKNIIYNGSASVRNGQFNCEFPVSADIDSEKVIGKAYFYAYNDFSDAWGYSDSIYMGGKNIDYKIDNEGPVIHMFMNNDKFIYGGITDSNPLLFARIVDKSGINTGGYQDVHNITVTLDEEDPVILNHNYMSDIDDYSHGTVWYRFSNLKEGNHTLRLDVWDNYNNHSSKEILFNVRSESNNIIKSFLNSPNPANEYTDFYFEHNMTDTEFSGKINIYNLSGQLVRIIKFEGIDTGYRYGPFRWNLDNERGERVRRGIYIGELLLKSKKGGILKASQKVVVTAY